MSSELSIGTLRLPHRRLDAEATIRRLGLVREPDRRVLVVRRMTVRADDPVTARQRLDDLRRRAAHPALGPVDPHAEAVEFADEAQALRCLSEDIAAGVARMRWWWRDSAPVAPPGEALTIVWTRSPRWVPAALAPIVREHCLSAAAMAALLSPEQVVRVVAAVTTAYGIRGPSAPTTPPAVPGTRPQPAREPGSLPRPTSAAALLLELVRALDERPATASTPALEAWLAASVSSLARAPAAAVAVAVSEPGAPAAQQPHANPGPSAVIAVDDPVDEEGESTDPPALMDRPMPVDRSMSVDGPTSIDKPGESTVTPFQRRRHAPRTPRPRLPDGVPWRHAPWTSSGPSTRTELATMLYAVNLVRLHRVSARDPDSGTGWAVVEAVSRWLLRGQPLPRRRRLLADPLFQILAELDGRPPDVRTPVRLGTATGPLRRFLTAHRIAPDTFAQPGTIVVSRTHVDVVLGLEQIDLAARSAGLDQDPGWVPDLGRVVLFHFEGG